MMKWSSEGMKAKLPIYVNFSRPWKSCAYCKAKVHLTTLTGHITWIKRMLNGNLHSLRRAMKKWQILSEVFSTRDQTRDLEVLYSRAVQRKLHYREFDGALSRWSQMWCIRKHEIQRSGVWLQKKNSNFIVVPSSWQNAGFRVIFQLSMWICRLWSRPIFFPAANENSACLLLKRDPLHSIWPKSSWIKLFLEKPFLFNKKLFVYGGHIVYFKLLNQFKHQNLYFDQHVLVQQFLF